jgi:hypothetical protein
MNYELFWYHPNRILYVRLLSESTAESVRQLIADIGAWAAQGTPLVHILVDVSQVQASVLTLGGLRDAAGSFKGEHIGWVLICGTKNLQAKFMGSVAVQVAVPDARLRMFETVDQALAFLRDVDSTLSDLALDIDENTA